MKLVLSDLFQRSKLIYARVVNKNVELTECLFRLGKQALNLFLRRYVSLDRDRFAAAFRNLIDHAICAFL